MDKINKSAREWQLFSDMEGADAAAQALNDAANAFVQAFVESAREWYRVADQHDEFGAMDTEPRAEFAKIVRKVIADYFGW